MYVSYMKKNSKACRSIGMHEESILCASYLHICMGGSRGNMCKYIVLECQIKCIMCTEISKKKNTNICTKCTKINQIYTAFMQECSHNDKDPQLHLSILQNKGKYMQCICIIGKYMISNMPAMNHKI